jgi:uncharacterized protein (TIGR03083 family)
MHDDAFEPRLNALAAVWLAWAEVGADLTDTDWHQMSRCEQWSVASLFAHHSVFPLAFANLMPSAPDETDEHVAVVVSAVDILRGFNRAGGVAHEMATQVADHAVEEARTVAPADLIARFSTTAPLVIDRLRDADPGQLLPWPAGQGLVRLVEALRIVLMEATVHLLDVLAALKREPALPAAALHETAALLAEMVDPVSFIETATGRSSGAVLPVLR